jgi:uridylate kinase
MATYKRILLKLSGEALMADKPYGIDPPRLLEYAQQVKEASELGVKIGIVIGGGNIFRGLKGVDKGFDRIKGDYMGMLATVINGLAIQSTLESLGAKARVLTAINMEPVGERYSKRRLEEAFTNNEIVIFTFGTGNPFFTTDTASALRAVEMEAEVVLKGTRVDGVYTADPEKDPTAKKFDEITFDEAYNRGLNVMDLTSFTMCKENKIPIIVFDMNTKGNLKRLLSGEKIGTLVKL